MRQQDDGKGSHVKVSKVIYVIYGVCVYEFLLEYCRF